MLKELKSLGIRLKRNNDLKGAEDLEYLTDAVKQSMYQDYKVAYSKDGDKYKLNQLFTCDRHAMD